MFKCKCYNRDCQKVFDTFSNPSFVYGHYFSFASKTFKWVPFCSSECYQEYKKRFEFCSYRNCLIYMISVNGQKRYMHDWEAGYYFTDIEDCKKRIDALSKKKSLMLDLFPSL